MKSLLKTAVQVNAHVELINTLISDAYEFSCQQFRRNLNIPAEMYLRQNAFYYRFMRQTGHNTAMKVLVSGKDSPHTTIVFAKGSFIKDFVRTLDTVEKGTPPTHSVMCLGSDAKGITPKPTEILIFCDLVSTETTKAGWDWLIGLYPNVFPELKQVVFLG